MQNVCCMAKFLSGNVSPLNSNAHEKRSQWLDKKDVLVQKLECRKHMCRFTDCCDMNLKWPYTQTKGVWLEFNQNKSTWHCAFGWFASFSPVSFRLLSFCCPPKLCVCIFQSTCR